MAQNTYGWTLDEATAGLALHKFVNTASELEEAKAKDDKHKIQELENIGRQFSFFRDSFGLIDYVEKRKNKGKELKSAFLSCDISAGFPVDWNDIPLKTESGEKLTKGFPGYEAALTTIMRRLRLYAFYNEKKAKEAKVKDKVKEEKKKEKVKEQKIKEKVNEETVRAEARRLLKESRLILEHRKGCTSATENEIDGPHKYVMELWEYL